jgi:hypothetical protein
MKKADFGRGIKAGVAAATVYIIIAVIFAAVGREFWHLSNFMYAAGLGISPGFVDFPFTIFSTVYSIISYVVRGIIFGAVFAALYNYLPGAISIVKGVMLSLFLWVLAVVQIIYTTAGWAWHGDGFSGSGTYYSGMISLSSVGLALAGIISALVFGVLVGAIWSGLRAKRVAEAGKGSSALLLSFILGAAMWVLPTIGLIIGVIIGGAPLIEAGPFWWYGVLFTSVVFVGLPGWGLALVAWRKTRSGKSGLKPGLAGGIIMALTGQMLLPGVLAIIGGVHSRRKPATESSAAATEQ